MSKHLRPIKVLFVHRTMNAGGAEKLTLDLIKRLDREKIESSLFLLNRCGQLLNEIPADIKTYHSKKRFPQKTAIFSFFNKLLILPDLIACAQKYDIIVGGLELKPTHYAMLAGLFTRKPVIGWVHSEIKQLLREDKLTWQARLFSILYPCLSKIVCVSNAVLENAIEVCPKIKRDKIQTINNFIDLKTVRESSLSRCPDNIKFSDNIPTIVSSGRLHNAKRYDTLIRIHARILKSGLVHKLVIVGEGGLRPKLTQLIDDLGVSQSVLLPGYFKNPHSIIKNCDLFVSSSVYEGFSLVVCEALALGIPVVSTSCGGPVGILGNGKYGVLTPRDDEKKLEQAIVNLLNDKPQRDKLSKLGKERAKDFDVNNIIPLWEQLFLDCALTHKIRL